MLDLVILVDLRDLRSVGLGLQVPGDWGGEE
jgi:hypothetical protein